MAAEEQNCESLQTSEVSNEQMEGVLKSAREAIFPTHKPRDALYGFKSGLYNIGSGVVTGATALVAAPIAGAQQDGIKGFGVGLGVGLMSAVALPVTGVVNGTRQIVRGVANTAEAVDAQFHNKVWDAEQECWVPYVPYSLPDEAARLLNDEPSGQSGNSDGSVPRRDPSHRVKDMTYYDLLNVPSNATAGEIKKGYYKEARKCHPDRNPDDPDAHKKFQQLGEAYRILSSTQLRAYYDRNGLEENDSKINTEMQMDIAKLFFAVMFGGERFEPYIGQLGFSTIMDNFMGGGGAGMNPDIAQGLSGFSVKELKKTQNKREVMCAVALADRINLFVDGKEEEFEQFVQAEVSAMSRCTFGEPLLRTIGGAYTLGAQKYLGGVEGVMATLHMRGKRMSSYFDVAKRGVESIHAAKELSDLTERERRAASQAPTPPTAQELQAKEEGYLAMSVKEIKAECAGRSVNLSGCLEKKDMVDRLMRDDERSFKKKLDDLANRQDGEETLSPEAQERIQSAMDKGMPTFLHAMISASLLDIEVTVKAAVEKVLKDSSVDAPARERRAIAILRLGKVFAAAKGQTKAARGEVEAKNIFQGTMMRTMAKAQGQEVHDDDEFEFDEPPEAADMEDEGEES